MQPDPTTQAPTSPVRNQIEAVLADLEGAPTLDLCLASAGQHGRLSSTYEGAIITARCWAGSPSEETRKAEAKERIQREEEAFGRILAEMRHRLHEADYKPSRRVEEEEPLDAAVCETVLASYLDAAFKLSRHAEEDGSEGSTFEYLNLDVDDLAPETLAEIQGDVADFVRLAGDRIAGHEDQAGADFWLTRNGHGAGFWDRPHVYGAEEAAWLTEHVKPYGSVDLYLGDDGLIYST